MPEFNQSHARMRPPHERPACRRRLQPGLAIDENFGLNNLQVDDSQKILARWNISCTVPGMTPNFTTRGLRVTAAALIATVAGSARAAYVPEAELPLADDRVALNRTNEQHEALRLEPVGNTVSAPGALALLGLGLVAIDFARRKRHV
jgi:hypothetical protein